jgi:hypothetical protein
MAEQDELIVETRTLGELVDAIKGYRQQLSVFSDHALMELERLEAWIKANVESGTPKIALHKLPRR